MENNLLIESLPRDARDFFEERAAILEYDGNFDTTTAENLALNETAKIFELHINQVKMNDNMPVTNPNENQIKVEISAETLQTLNTFEEKLPFYVAQDFIRGVMYYGLKLGEKSYIISSEPSMFPLEEAPLKKLYPITTKVRKSSFSQAGISFFLKQEKLNLVKLFYHIRNYIKRFVYLSPDSLYDLLSLWVMGTYIFRIFRYFPYIHLFADKNSGKTFMMEILKPICFNGELSASSTAAVIFRKTETNSPTMFIDEAERFFQYKSEANDAMMEVLNSGYNINGIAERCSKEDYSPITFSTYCPKMFASINEFFEVLRDRTIKIRMLRKTEMEKVENYTESNTVLKFHKLVRDRLYVFGLYFANDIYEKYSNFNSDTDDLGHLNNRLLDLWKPIFSLAYLIDYYSDNPEERSLTKNIVELSITLTAEKYYDDSTDNPTLKAAIVVNRMINELPATKTENSNLLYDTSSTLGYFQNQDEFEFLSSKTSLSRILNKIGIMTKTIKCEGNSKRAYIIDKKKVDEYIARYS